MDLVDQQFLRSQVFAKGVSRCLVVVNHDPAATQLNDSQLKDVVENIRAQLQGMGRDLPITTIRLRETVAAAGDLSRPIRSKIVWNNSRGTATSAI